MSHIQYPPPSTVRFPLNAILAHPFPFFSIISTCHLLPGVLPSSSNSSFLLPSGLPPCGFLVIIPMAVFLVISYHNPLPSDYVAPLHLITHSPPAVCLSFSPSHLHLHGRLYSLSTRAPHSMSPLPIHHFPLCAPAFALASTSYPSGHSTDLGGGTRSPPRPKGAELVGPFSIPMKQLLRQLVVVIHRLHHKWKVQRQI
jgi:hypothetical protein